MTGEITLRGRVLKIGGLKEKVIAAHRNKIRTVIIPAENMSELEEISKEILKDMEIVPATVVDDVLKVALAPQAETRAAKPAPPAPKKTPAPAKKAAKRGRLRPDLHRTA